MVIRHIDLTLPGFMDDSALLYGAIAFLTNTAGPAGPCAQHCWHAAFNAEECQGVSRAPLLNHALVLLTEAITAGPFYRHAVQSIKADLLPALMDVSRYFTDECVVKPLNYFLRKVLPAAMVSYWVLWPTVMGLDSLTKIAISPKFRKSETFPVWQDVRDLAQERFCVLVEYSATAGAMRASDNVRNVNPQSTSVASAVAARQYTVVALRVSVWIGARASIESPAKTSNQCVAMNQGNDEPLCGRELSFMRALLHSDYLAHRCQVLCRQLGHIMCHPDTDFYTLFWYTEGKVDIDVHAIGEYPERYDWDVAWDYYARRKAQSEGRMDLFLAMTSTEHGTRAQMFPRRCRDARVSDGLKEIARTTPPMAVGDDLGEIFEPLILALVAQDEGSIH
ncbi:hypothetical protein B0H17DRAFT_1230154 [Mycena rosella]|uniref:Uncharacterized protein n=1 Tax=Mycena rosella TaxID=1033263 RepID=A0AAD7GDR1_MYCRO|nr:hypothetical protein B0H17DRAFT_1230154 [Mycena rosella]